MARRTLARRLALTLDPHNAQDCTNLTGVLEKRRVPSVSLEVVLRDWLAGRRVALAKVDAQGLDVGVVRSAGSAVHRLQAVQLEVVRDLSRPLPLTLTLALTRTRTLYLILTLTPTL